MSSPPEIRTLNFDEIRAASAAIELDDVHCTDIRWHADPFERGIRRLSFNHSLALVEWSMNAELKSLSVWLHFEVTGDAFANDEGGEDVAEEMSPLSRFALRSTWCVRYSLRSGVSAEGEVMGDFVFANGQLNVFPYLRQQVQDLTSKAGWPPLLLPVFRAPSERPVGCARERGKSPGELTSGA